MKITISGKDQTRLKLIRKLAEELGLSVSDGPEKNKVKEANGAKLYQIMEEMAASKAFNCIKDPVKWQKEQRKDRPLPGRN